MPPALPPSLPRTDPSAISYLKRENGVPSSQVQKLAFDARGRLWLATPSGLASYDGARVRTWARRQGLRSDGLHAVVADDEDRLWVGSDAGYDLLHEDRVLDTPLAEGGWPFGYVQCLLSVSGRTWLGTSRGLLACDGQALRPVAEPALGDAPVRCLAQSRGGRVWAAGGNGLWVRDDGHWRQVPGAAAGEPGDIVSLAGAAGDGALVGTRQGFVELAPDGRPRARQADDGRVRPARCLALVNGSLWAALGDELLVYERVKGDWCPARIVLTGQLFNDLLPDRFGNLWAASESHGVAKISVLGRAIRNLPMPTAQAVFAVRSGNRGRLLVGGESATSLRDPDDPACADKVAALAGRQVWDIRQDADGSLLAATAGGLVHVDADGSMKLLGRDNPVLKLPTRCIEPHDGRLYVSGVGGCVAVDKEGAVETVPVAGDEDIGYVYTLQQDTRGRLWAGTVANGLWRLDGGRLCRYRHEALSPQGNTYAIAVHPDGRLAFVQDDRIFLLTPRDELTLLAETEDPIAGWALRFAPDGTLWAGSGSGLVQYDAGTGRQLKQVISLLGISNWEFTTSRSLFIHESGRFFCGVNSGLVEVDTHAIAELPELPAVSVGAVQWERVAPEQRGERLVVPYRRWTLALDVFTSWFVDESDVQYRFRLTGFDEDWRDLQAEPSIRLNTLPPGDYQLEAQAYNRLVGFGPASVLMSLRVERPPLLRRMFAAPLSGFTEMRRIRQATERNQRLNRENLELQQLVDERTADLEQAKQRLEDMNRELANQSVTDALTGIGNRRLFDEQLEAAVVEARRSGKALSLLLIDVDYFKPYNDLYGHARGDEALVFVARQLLATLFRPGDQVARYGGEEFAALLRDAAPDGALAVAQRLRQATEDLRIEHSAQPDTGVVTISIGVTTWNPLATTVAPGTGKQLIESADTALYDAKQRGRNTVCFRPLAGSH